MNFFVKVRNVGLVILSVVVYAFRKKHHLPVGRIMVIQNAKMGDMVCTTPLFRAIKGKYPKAKLLVMGNALNKDLLLGNPYVDRYITRPESFSVLRTVIKREEMDAVVLPAPDTEALFASMLSLVPLISLPTIEGGWSPYATKAYRFLSKFAVSAPHKMGSYAPREYLRLLEVFDIYSEDTKKDVFVSTEAMEKVDALLSEVGAREERLVGIAPSAGNKIKSWGGWKFAKVAEALSKNFDIRVVIIGGINDANEVREMTEALSSEAKVINFSGKLSVEELKALIRRLSLFISVDTGPLYIAEAFGVSTVDIVGPMDENEQPPRGARNRVVVPVRKAPALHIMNASVFDKDEARRQVEAILPEMVIAEATDLLES